MTQCSLLNRSGCCASGKFKATLTGSQEEKMTPITETDYRQNCPHQNFYCQCRKLAFKKHSFLQSQFLALTTSFGVDSTACSSNSAISSDWRHFFVPRTSQCRLEFSSVQKECINAHTHQGLTLSGSRQR